MDCFAVIAAMHWETNAMGAGDGLQRCDVGSSRAAPLLRRVLINPG